MISNVTFKIHQDADKYIEEINKMSIHFKACEVKDSAGATDLYDTMKKPCAANTDTQGDSLVTFRSDIREQKFGGHLWI